MQVYSKEVLNGYYPTSAYVMASTIASSPFLFLISMSSSICAYFLAGLNDEGDAFIYFVVILFIALLVSTAVSTKHEMETKSEVYLGDGRSHVDNRCDCSALPYGYCRRQRRHGPLHACLRVLPRPERIARSGMEISSSLHFLPDLCVHRNDQQ